EPQPTDGEGLQAPSVLSLGRNYDRFLVPRLDVFERMYPEVRTVKQLQALMSQFPSDAEFLTEALNYRDARRAATLRGVVDWLSGIEELEAWAASAKPEDVLSLNIRGFGIAGFQYLRMMFGADTTKPDVHIVRFVETAIGHSCPPARAVALLEKAANELGVRV